MIPTLRRFISYIILRMNLSNILKKVTLIVFGITLVLALLMGIDRLVGAYLYKTGYFYAMNPGKVLVFDTLEYHTEATISAQGIRNDIVKNPKPNGTYRILAIGDSFTYGWGVYPKDSWVKKTEEFIRSQGKPIEIINAAIPGVGTTTETDACRAYADRFDVDMILLGFYGTDDLYQNAGRALFEEKEHTLLDRLFPTLFKIRTPVLVDALGVVTKQTTPLYINKNWSVRARDMFTEHPDAMKRLSHDAISGFLSGGINSDILTFSYTEPDYVVKMLDERNLEFALSETFKQLDVLKRTCAKGRPVVIVLLPPMEMVNSEYQTYRKNTGYNVDPALLDLDIETPLADGIRSRDMSIISVFSSFRADGCPGCYYPWDIHMTPLGNDRVAHIVAPNLLKLIP